MAIEINTVAANSSEADIISEISVGPEHEVMFIDSSLVIGNPTAEGTKQEPIPTSAAEIDGDFTGEDNPILVFVSKIKGLLLIFCAGMMFTALSALSKTSTVGIGTYIACEGFFNIVVVAPIAMFSGESLSPMSVTPVGRKWFWIRVTTGAFAYFGKMAGIKYNNIGDATAIYFTAPLWAGLFARIMLKERYTIINVISSVLGFGGIILVSKPSFIFGSANDETSLTWTLFIAGVAVIAGFSYASQRACGDSASTFICTVYLGFFQIPMGLIATPILGDSFENPSCYLNRGLLVGCGLTAGLGYCLLNRGMAIEKLGPATLMRNADTVVAYVMQMVFFGVSPDWLSLTGAGMIITSTIIVTLDKIYDFSCGITF